jgi:hypothetical protein
MGEHEAIASRDRQWAAGPQAAPCSPSISAPLTASTALATLVGRASSLTLNTSMVAGRTNGAMPTPKRTDVAASDARTTRNVATRGGPFGVAGEREDAAVLDRGLRGGRAGGQARVGDEQHMVGIAGGVNRRTVRRRRS